MSPPDRTNTPVLAGAIFEEDSVLSLDELSRVCAVGREHIIELVEEGVLTIIQTTTVTTVAPADWLFTGECLRRARLAVRLQRDLGVNAAGAALAIELMEEISALRRQLLESD